MTKPPDNTPQSHSSAPSDAAADNQEFASTDADGAYPQHNADKLQQEVFQQILDQLNTQIQIDFAHYKQSTLRRRISRRMGLIQTNSISDYLTHLTQNPTEADALKQDFLIGVTSFFRDLEAFDYLAREVIPELIDTILRNTPENKCPVLRIWCCGCATGEEAYSLAMIALENIGARERNVKLQIFASDIDEVSLKTARMGVYPKSIEGYVCKERLTRFFESQDDHYKITQQVRETVVFSNQNVITDPPFSKIDLISCRNLMIYLQPVTQKRVLSMFHFAMNPNARLFLGNSETVRAQEQFFRVDSKKWRVFVRREMSVKLPLQITTAKRTPRFEFDNAMSDSHSKAPQLRRFVEDTILARFTPACIFISDDAEILYSTGPTNEFLRLPHGEPTNSLYDMVTTDIALSLRAAIKDVLKNGQEVKKEKVAPHRYHKDTWINLTVYPAPEFNGVDILVVVFSVFEMPRLESDTAGSSAEHFAHSHNQIIGELERELRTSKSDLKNIIMEFETSNEELKASNEEVMSMNEELQSTNEELETSKEELQTLNEELSAVNAQLQEKVAELETANADMDNFLNGTNVATLFLDKQLNIRRFTPMIESLFYIKDSDIGRDIDDIKLRFNESRLKQLSASVLQTLIPHEAVIQADNQQTYLFRIMPYRSKNDRIDGVVVTFVDITELNQLQQMLAASEARLKLFVEHAPAALAMFDTTMQQLMVSRRWREQFSEFTLQTKGNPLPVVAAWQAAHNSAIDGQATALQRDSHTYPDGRMKCLNWEMRPWYDQDEQVGGSILFAEDITDVVLAQRNFKMMFEENPLMLFTIDQEGKVITANQQAIAELGYSHAEIIGQSISEFFPQEEKKRLQSLISAAMRNIEETQQQEIRQIRKDMSTFHSLASVRALQRNAEQIHAILALENIDERKSIQEQLTYQANHDAVTGLANRHAFEIMVEELIQSAKSKRFTHALCFIDLDQFKVINDSCGHPAGDSMLKQLSTYLKAIIRRQDMLARVGGDEFAILMERCSLRDAERLADQILTAIRDFKFEHDEQVFNVSASIGVVEINTQTLDFGEVLRRADAACYMAKEAGRNRIHVYEMNNAEIAQRHREIRNVSKIVNAIENQELQLFGQPIIGLADTAIDGPAGGMEILVRMQDTDGKLLLPGSFMPAAERYNVVTKVDRCVIQSAFAFINQHPQTFAKWGMCSINLSGASITEAGFLEFIIDQLEHTELGNAKICFEITETNVISNLDKAQELIKQLKERGCLFALDDFGSGVSSFGYLKYLDVDFLKIDSTFVKDMHKERISYAMVKSINDIGQIMGMKTIAEGVEHEAILDCLREIGVDYAQGFHIAMPAPIEPLTD